MARPLRLGLLFLIGLVAAHLSTATFFKRKGGIDVSNHSKRNRFKFLYLTTTTSSSTSLAEATTMWREAETTEEEEVWQEVERTEPTRRSFFDLPQPETTVSTEGLKPALKVGIVLPRQIFQQRRYQKIISSSLSSIRQTRGSLFRERSNPSSPLDHVRLHYQFEWSQHSFKLFDEDDSINFGDLEVSPPPADVTSLLCQHVTNGSAAIIYFTNTEKFGRTTAASQYFLKMAGFLGIPVLAWNADNTGLDREVRSRDSDFISGHLQLAPSMSHQVSALLSILHRYGWRQFGILTTTIAGHDDFVQAVRDSVKDDDRRKFVLQHVFKTSEATNWDLSEIAGSEVRIILLYCTQAEASILMTNAAKLGLTNSNYMWLVTQSVIGNPLERNSYRKSLPVGMIGVHFEVELEHVLEEFVSLALQVFFKGAEQIISWKPSAFETADGSSCESIDAKARWELGAKFYEYMKNVSIDRGFGKNSRRGKRLFYDDGSMVDAELKILNFKPSSSSLDSSGQWEEVGTWNSWNGLDIKDIVWPGGSHVPPQGVPEGFHIKITFLEEPPFIIVSEPDPVTRKCTINRGVACRMSESSSADDSKCCSGLCIDLLRKFEADLAFTYELVRVNDTKFGTLEHGRWNGLMGELVEKRTDMVLSALKINAQRESVVDFSVPFLESGIAIAVAKRTGIISPTAFLEPFDLISWFLVIFVAIQAAALAIFFFEWLSPSGYNMQTNPSKEDHKFSLFRTYWLVWAVLFQASVKIDCPRGLTARFMSIIWALFAVVFLSLYTANLAAFMIPREEYYDFSGIDDPRISNPLSQKPGLRFCTIPYSYTEATLQQHHPEVFSYTKRFSYYNTTANAIKAVKNGALDAFIYDGTVLNYLASQDEECRVLQVGSWSALTGYALAFPVHSKYKDMFDAEILELRENGDLERLSRFWMSGMCKPNEQEKRASEPLSIAQFLSAFLLLGIGSIISIVLFLLEYVYVKYLHNHIDQSSSSGCISLISMSIGRSAEAASNARRMMMAASNGGDASGEDISLEPLEDETDEACDDHDCRQSLRLLKSELFEAEQQIASLERQLLEAEVAQEAADDDEEIEEDFGDDPFLPGNETEL